VKNKTIDDFVKIKLVTVQDDGDSTDEGAKIYGYNIETVGNMVKDYHIHLIHDNKGLNKSMAQNYWSDFMKSSSLEPQYLHLGCGGMLIIRHLP